jgi:hypothetical protein
MWAFVHATSGFMRLKKALLDFYSLPMQSLEASENWNNCVIWNLERIKMVETTHVGIRYTDLEKSEKKCCGYSRFS